MQKVSDSLLTTGHFWAMISSFISVALKDSSYQSSDYLNIEGSLFLKSFKWACKGSSPQSSAQFYKNLGQAIWVAFK